MPVNLRCTGGCSAGRDAHGRAHATGAVDDADGHVGALLTLTGAQCGDPARAANAALNVSLRDVHHVATGFGSVWASPWFGTAIFRLDSASGEVLATIDVGAPTRRLQPADGRVIVRTTDTYVAVDPATNTVMATLPKSEVGPFADRGAAADGALWIPTQRTRHRARLRLRFGVRHDRARRGVLLQRGTRRNRHLGSSVHRRNHNQPVATIGPQQERSLPAP